jgi:hypothetical protein
MKRMWIPLAIVVVAVFAANTHAAVINYLFPIDGSQVVPPVSTPATGTGMVTLDTVGNTIDWNITFQGLLGTETAAHFHGPAPAGSNAGVQVPLPLGSPKIGQSAITDAQEADIMAGLWYVNIHSSMYPGGEIRGQVVPEPASLAVLGIGALAVMLRRRCR